MVSPTGTINRTVYDALGRAASTWVGTNDTPASGDWSPTNNTSPSNMVEVASYEYDNGGVGDGTLTKVTEYPGGGTPPRETDNFYDWRDRRTDTDVGPRDGQAVLFDLYARARAEAAHGGVSFAQAFAQAFRDTVPQLSDRDAYAVTDWRVTPTAFQQAMQDGLDHLRPKRSITPNEAIDLIWGYLLLDARRRLDPLLEPLAREDDGRRYEIEDDLRIETSAGVLQFRKKCREVRGASGAAPACTRRMSASKSVTLE